MFFLLAVLLVLSACGSEGSSRASKDSGDETGKKTIVMGQTSWAENIAVTNMWKVILDDKGYDLQLKVLEMGTQMAGLANGDLDISPEV